LPELEGRWGQLTSRVFGWWGVPRYELRGVAQLGQWVSVRAASLAKPDQREATQEWIRADFTFPVRSLLWATARSRRSYVAITLGTVAGGFATSGIAVAAGSGTRGSAVSWIVFGIGLIVALAGGLSQIFRPSQRAFDRQAVLVKMREEGWSFAMATGDYAASDQQVLFVFQARVFALQRRIAQIGQLEVKPPPAEEDSDGEP
jgi:hypothetical protein